MVLANFQVEINLNHGTCSSLVCGNTFKTEIKLITKSQSFCCGSSWFLKKEQFK